MINNAIQLKAKVRNVSGGDAKTAKAYIRIFFMERFMERVSLSLYRDSFIIKGEMLVSSLLGINLRSTMDIDTTVKALPLTIEDVSGIIREICDIELYDNVTFRITNVETIMEDFDYPGVRVHLEALLDRLRQPVKIDISTDDVITPGAVEYEYKLMFEDRSIYIYTYNVETTLAEKSQTIINRGLANTRMRDFFDMYELVKNVDFSMETARSAFKATCKKRETEFSYDRIEAELNAIKTSDVLELLWNNFKVKNHFVGELEFKDVVNEVCNFIKDISGG